MNKYLIRSKNTGRFISRTQAKRLQTMSAQPREVVSGRLYNFMGATVRAGRKVNQMRLVTFHKRLVGYARDNELSLITPKKVVGYLENATKKL